MLILRCLHSALQNATSPLPRHRTNKKKLDKNTESLTKLVGVASSPIDEGVLSRAEALIAETADPQEWRGLYGDRSGVDDFITNRGKNRRKLDLFLGRRIIVSRALDGISGIELQEARSPSHRRTGPLSQHHPSSLLPPGEKTREGRRGIPKGGERERERGGGDAEEKNKEAGSTCLSYLLITERVKERERETDTEREK